MNFSRATARSEAKNAIAPAVSRWRLRGIAWLSSAITLTASPPIAIVVITAT